MGNFFKNVWVLALLPFSILFLAGCSDEEPVDANETSTEVSAPVSDNQPFGTEGLPEGYLQTSFMDNFGYDTLLDMKTFRPAQLPGLIARELTQNDIEALAAWRSPKGVPWTAWAYGKDFTLESFEMYGIRGVASGFLIPDETYQAFRKFLLEQEGIEPTPEVMEYITNGGTAPKFLEGIDVFEIEYFLTRWFRENVSAMTPEVFTGIVESYAWYTSPGYQKGTLPSELEGALDLLGRGVVSENYIGFGQAEDWANRASKIIREGISEIPEGPFYASFADLMFLHKDEIFAALGQYQNLLGVVSSYEVDPGSFLEKKEEFAKALEAIPEQASNGIKTYGENLLADLELLSAKKDAPDSEVVDGRYGELPLAHYRALLPADVDTFKTIIEAFIERWSELQSSGD